jgi:hypothetical protein
MPANGIFYVYLYGFQKMTIKVNFIDELQLVQSVFGVTYTLQDIKESTLEAQKMSVEKGVNRFIIDCTNLKQGRSIMDIHAIGSIFADLDVTRGIKQAVIVPEISEIQKNSLFYETTMRNRGYEIKAFTDRSKAVAWLKQD